MPHIGLSLTSIVAVYGAVLSTVTVFIALSNHFRDRPEVKITVRKNMRPTFPDRRYAGMTLVIVTATNVGRRPVRIDGFAAGLLFKKGQRHTDWILPDVRPPIPRETIESQTVSAFLNQANVDFDSISHWYVWDSVGRHYRLNLAPWYKRVFSGLRYKWSRREAQPHEAQQPSALPELTNAMTNVQVVGALRALQRGEQVGQRILRYLAAEQFIVVDDVTNMDTPRGQKEYLFITVTDKGQRLLDG
jgi:hypothetical protein